MRQEVAVVIPVYNESKVIASVIGSVQKSFPFIVCVDDGSADKSAEVIKESGAILVRHPINLGQGAALQTGIEYALQNEKTRYFITFDADGQHHIEDAIRMVHYIKEHDVDIVFGSRFLGKAENITTSKKMLLRLARIFSRFETGVKLTDTHVGLRVFNRRFAENLNLSMSDYSHASEIVRRVKEGGYKYIELPVTITYSAYSRRGGQPMLNAVNVMFDLLLHRATKR